MNAFEAAIAIAGLAVVVVAAILGARWKLRAEDDEQHWMENSHG